MQLLQHLSFFKLGGPFKVIAIEGSEILNHNFVKKPEILILDGQQRLTSLFYALHSPDIPLKNTANPYTFFLNLEEISNDNIEDSVFSWSRECGKTCWCISRYGV